MILLKQNSADTYTFQHQIIFVCDTSPFPCELSEEKNHSSAKAYDRIGKVTSHDSGPSYVSMLSLSSESINNEGSWFVLNISKPLVVCLGRLCSDLCPPGMVEEPPYEEWYLSALYLQLLSCSDDKRMNHRKWILSCVWSVYYKIKTPLHEFYWFLKKIKSLLLQNYM